VKQLDNLNRKLKYLQYDRDDVLEKLRRAEDRAETWKKAYEQESRRK
jgi:hypothetical protein